MPPTTPYIRPDVQMMLDLLKAQEGPKTHETDPATARALMDMVFTMAERPAGALAIKRDFTLPGPAGDIPARLYDPRESREPGPVVVFYHGGGFVIGNIETHDGLCAETARTLDLPVVSVDYRLAPEDPFPAAPEDCIAAARWIATSPSELGLRVTGLIPAGDSAGGNLAAVTSLALRDEPADVPVIAQWLIYPATDMSADGGSMADFAEGFLLEAATMEWFGNHYAGDETDWRLNPVLRDTAGLPPTVLVTAGLDPLRDHGREYAGKLIEGGVHTVYREASGNIHGFANLRKIIPSAHDDIVACLDALKLILAEIEAEAVTEQAAAAE
ncbi:MAG: alpha/beta hydrolase [Pseudomonadota bacterium]